MNISDFFINCDMSGLIEYMKEDNVYSDILPSYISIFEKEEYLTYDVPDGLNKILKFYQIYYGDLFYLKIEKNDAENKLFKNIGSFFNTDNFEEYNVSNLLSNYLSSLGYRFKLGKTQGIYGPYIWENTISKTFKVTLPSGDYDLKINILDNFIFKGYMSYLTFGMYGSKGFMDTNGLINIFNGSYDYDSEEFILILKHEAQHSIDYTRYIDILPNELEYRAKLVELIYSNDLSLINKFISEGRDDKEFDSHAMASNRIKEEYSLVNINDINEVKSNAKKLLNLSNIEMDKKYL